MEKRKRIKVFVEIGVSAVVAAGVGVLAWRMGLLPEKTYTGEDFGIERLISEVDFDGDGIDDYTEILNGARKDAENHPRYDGSYVEGGYPADDVGVCTDVIWRALKEAGYELREMLDEDIREHPEDYPWIEAADKNIDFRRVRNIERYLEKYAEKLTTDAEEIGEWQAGDIVVWRGGTHIGVVSDRRDAEGRPYIIHNAGQPVREEKVLSWERIDAHYRWLLRR